MVNQKNTQHRRKPSAVCLFFSEASLLIHQPRRQHGFTFVPGKLVFSHQRCGAYGTISEPPSQIINGIFEGTAAFAALGVIENVQLQRLINGNQVDAADGQRTDRLGPQIALLEKIIPCAGYFKRALCWKGQRNLILSAAQLVILDRDLHPPALPVHICEADAAHPEQARRGLAIQHSRNPNRRHRLFHAQRS